MSDAQPAPARQPDGCRPLEIVCKLAPIPDILQAMLAILRGASPGALLFAMLSLVVLACGDDRRLPPPPLPPFTPTTSSTSSGSGGAGGDPGDDYYCSCVAAFEINWMTGEGCVRCVNQQQEYPTDPCYSLSAQCQAHAQCLDIIVCLYTVCKYDADCTSTCILPFDKDEGHRLFRDVLECSCSRCQPTCTHPDILTCGGWAGTGGAGGSGGVGGAGGSGGAAGAGGSGAMSGSGGSGGSP